jgi:hypothetical protein
MERESCASKGSPPAMNNITKKLRMERDILPVIILELTFSEVIFLSIYTWFSTQLYSNTGRGVFYRLTGPQGISFAEDD